MMMMVLIVPVMMMAHDGDDGGDDDPAAAADDDDIDDFFTRLVVSRGGKMLEIIDPEAGEVLLRLAGSQDPAVADTLTTFDSASEPPRVFLAAAVSGDIKVRGKGVMMYLTMGILCGGSGAVVVTRAEGTVIFSVMWDGETGEVAAHFEGGKRIDFLAVQCPHDTEVQSVLTS
jgi:hypothetical protein